MMRCAENYAGRCAQPGCPGFGTIHETDEDLGPIDGDDTGEFSAEFVCPILREDVDDWEYDRLQEMGR